MKLGFGKHADAELEDIPDKYLQWLIRSSQEKIDMCESELRRRTPKVNNSMMARLVKAGTDALHHSSDPEEIPDINRASDALMKAITDAAGESK
jgi:hypothetical protein